MDPKEYKQRLEELAEIVPIKVPHHKGRKPDEPVVVHRNGEEIVIPEDSNHTLTYKIKKIKNDVRKCEDCNKRVKNRTISRKLYQYPIRHWRNLCNNCSMFQHPETGRYMLVGVSAQNAWNSWLKKNHPDLQTVPQPEPELQPDLALVEKKPAK